MKRKAFTVIELIVVMVLLLFLTAAVIIITAAVKFALNYLGL